MEDNSPEQLEPTTEPFAEVPDMQERLGGLEIDGYRTAFVKRVGLLPAQLTPLTNQSEAS